MSTIGSQGSGNRPVIRYGWLAAVLLASVAGSRAAGEDATDPVRRDVEVLLVKGRAAEALPLVERLVALAPADVRLQELRGRIWAQAGRLAELRGGLAQSAADHPGDPGPRLFLAQLPGCSQEQRRQHLDAALRCNPDYAPALLARWKLADRDSELAARLRQRIVDPVGELAVEVRTFIAAPPSHDDKREQLRDSLIKRTHVQETRNPGDPHATFLRAELLLAEDQRPDALHAIDLGRYVAPADPWGYRLQARLHLDQRQPHKGLAELERALRVTPRTPALLELEVRARLQEQRVGEALALLERVGEAVRPQAPELVDELHATVAWTRRDRQSLATVLARRQAEQPGSKSQTWRRFEGYLAYLDGEVAGVREATLDLPGPAQGELPRLRRALEDQARRRTSGVIFVTVLSAILLALVAVGGHVTLRNRRTMREANQ